MTLQAGGRVGREGGGREGGERVVTLLLFVAWR